MIFSKITEISYFLPKTYNLSGKKNFKEIYLKTGIAKTRIAEKNQDVIDLAFFSCKKIKKKIKNIDGIIFVTQTPKYLLPSCSCILQDRLKIKKNIFTIDINMGCSGYIYGLSVANSLIQSNSLKKVLLICADTYSKYMDNKNKNRFLFSDAASATILQRSKNKRFNNFLFNSDGKKYDKIIIKENNKKLSFQMEGSSVYTFTLQEIPILLKKFLKISKKKISDYRQVFFHQASSLVLKNLQRKIKNEKKIYIDLKNIGNTTSSSIPISIKNALNKGIIKKNDEIILCGFGSGLTWSIVSVKI
jgi:3-oxoacyl-[acyl-carrier-protein] synthase-3